jgi:HSP20 family molecular chaperone IbpA
VTWNDKEEKGRSTASRNSIKAAKCPQYSIKMLALPQFMAADVFQTLSSYTIIADLPQLTNNNLQVTVESNHVQIIACRETKICNNNASCVARERFCGTIERIFEIPSSFDTGQVSASLSDGVLTLSFPKTNSCFVER